jgi:hypothetical protein
METNSAIWNCRSTISSNKEKLCIHFCNFTHHVLWPVVCSPALDNRVASHYLGTVKTLVLTLHKNSLTLWLSQQRCCRLQYFGFGVLWQLVTSHQRSEGSYCHYFQSLAVQNTWKNGDLLYCWRHYDPSKHQYLFTSHCGTTSHKI